LSNFIIKNEQPRIRPNDPRTNPVWKEEEAKARRHWPKVQSKFKSEEEKRRYIKAVESNPMNHLGSPALYPPLEIVSYIQRAQWNCATQGHRWSLNQEKFCLECDIDKPKEGAVTQTNDTSESKVHVVWCKQCQKLQPHTTTADAAYCDVCNTRWTVERPDEAKP
jgi:hypothetical protein